MSQFSLNNRIVVEAYKTDKSLKATVSNGFAMVTQKVALVGLPVLMSTTLADGRYIPAGSVAYIREQILHTQPWAQVPLQCDSIDKPFLIVEMNFVEFVNTPGDTAA